MSTKLFNEVWGKYPFLANLIAKLTHVFPAFEIKGFEILYIILIFQNEELLTLELLCLIYKVHEFSHYSCCPTFFACLCISRCLKQMTAMYLVTIIFQCAMLHYNIPIPAQMTLRSVSQAALPVVSYCDTVFVFSLTPKSTIILYFFIENFTQGRLYPAVRISWSELKLRCIFQFGIVSCRSTFDYMSRTNVVAFI